MKPNTITLMPANPSIAIQYARDTVHAVPNESLLISWVQAALDDITDEITLRFVRAPESQTLNKTYRHKDAPTNVLSFPCESLAGIDTGILGDVVLCTDVILAEAHQQQKTRDAHYAHMIIHGILHLRGFDHETASDAAIMEAREIRLLQQLGFPNPYGALDDE